MGDRNYDGRPDLFVRQRPQIVLVDYDVAIPIVLKPPVTGFVLENRGDGTFQLVSNLTRSEEAILSAWPQSTINAFRGDFNADGYFDLNLRGVRSTIPGAFDQLVFASAASGSGPSAVRAMDADFRAYFKEAYEWISDPSYFERAAITNGWYKIEVRGSRTAYWKADYLQFWGFSLTSNGQTLVRPEDRPRDQSSPPNGCAYVRCVFDTSLGVWLLLVYAEDRRIIYEYFRFNQNARSTAGILASTLQRPENEAGASQVSQLESILSSVLRTGIDLPLPGEIVVSPAAVPIPIPDNDTLPRAKLPRLGWLSLLLYTLDLAEWANERVDESRMVYHYANANAEAAIKSSGTLINPTVPNGGPVYFTYASYPTSELAEERLALCGPPRTGYFIVKKMNVPRLSAFTPVPPIDCPNGGPHRGGGGWEATATSPVSALPLRFIPIAERY